MTNIGKLFVQMFPVILVLIFRFFCHSCVPFRSRSRPVFNDSDSGSGSEQTVSTAPAPTKICRLRRLRLRLRIPDFNINLMGVAWKELGEKSVVPPWSEPFRRHWTCCGVLPTPSSDSGGKRLQDTKQHGAFEFKLRFLDIH